MVTLNEEGGEVTYEVAVNGNLFREKAIFTADTVAWGDRGGGLTTMQFSVSRIDLSFNLSVLFDKDVLQSNDGECVLTEPPDRAF